MMRFLVTNDDGVYAPGLDALIGALSPLGEVIVVAPDRERSATAHAITLHKPLRVEKVSRNGAFYGYAASGTPVDCVKLAMVSLLDEPPDFVVAGINPGTNVGTNAIYSGTVAAAVEGAMNGVTSIAISVDSASAAPDDEPDYTAAAEFAARFIRSLVANECPRGMLFSINVPDVPRDQIRGVRITRQGRLTFREQFHERTDPQRRRYYWLGGELSELDEADAASGDTASGDQASGPSTDSMAVRDGYISVTPIHYDLTDYAAIERVRSWSFE
jgi:5'-nucleotidase